MSAKTATKAEWYLALSTEIGAEMMEQIALSSGCSTGLIIVFSLFCESDSIIGR